MRTRKRHSPILGARPLAAHSPPPSLAELGAMSTTSKGWGLGLAMGAAASAAVWWFFFRVPKVSGGKAAGYEEPSVEASVPPALPPAQ